MTDKDHHLATCMIAICDPIMASNPVPWFDLEREGMTREALKKRVAAGE